jgi:uncharacterized protein YgbK (DUF1537 family)
VSLSTPTWLVVADDLTGAAEAAAVWARPDGPVPVAVRPTALDRLSPGSGLVVATLARDADPDRWEARWTAWETALRGRVPPLVMVKMDSLLRGRWAADVGRMRALCRPDTVVLAPALPDQDRVVIGGRVRWHGRLLEATEMAGSVPSSRLADYFPGEPCAFWKPGAPWPEAGLVVADATSDADLDALVAAAASEAGRVLWVGTRGLIGALARAGGGGGARPPQASGPPVLVLVGSQTAMAQSQVEALAERYPVMRLGFDDGTDLEPPDAPAVVVTSQGVPPPAGGAAAVHAGWVRAARRLLAVRPWAAVVVTGGETATALLEASGADGIQVLALDRDGSVAAQIWGGPHGGLRLWTKSGSFGERKTLVALTASLIAPSPR